MAFAVLTSLILAGVMGFLLNGLREQVEEAERSELSNLARVFEEHVLGIVRDADLAMQALRNGIEADPEGFRLEWWLATNVGLRDQVAQVALIDAKGSMTATSVAGARLGIDLSDREHFRVQAEAKKDALFISVPVLGRASGKWTLQLTRRFVNRDGAFAGVIVFSIDAAYLSRFYNSVDIGEHGTVQLVGLDGVVRASADSLNGAPGGSIKGTKLYESILRVPVATVMENAISRAGKSTVLTAYRILPGYPLVVAIGADSRDYMAPYRAKLPLILTLGGGALATTMGFAALFLMQSRRQERAEAELIRERLDLMNSQAEGKVRAEEEIRYRAATDAASDAIVSWDREGRIIFANPSARRIFGLESGSLRQIRYQSFFAPSSSDELARALESVMAGKPGTFGRTLEVDCRRSDGTVFAAEIALNLWSSHDSAIVTMVCRDISERRRNEEERKSLLTAGMQAQKMEAIGTLAGGIAHDFNNVLGAMLGFLWLAQREAPADSKLASNITKAIAAGKRATLVVKQLLDFSRAGTPTDSVFDVRKVIDEIAELAPASIPTSVARSFVSATETLPIRGDATQLHQSILNLVINAVQAIGHGVGRLDVSAKRVEITGELAKDSVADAGDGLVMLRSVSHSGKGGGKIWYGLLRAGPHVRIAVSDSGAGMSEGVMKRIFDPFFTTKAVGEGTGLGLSVLHGVIKSMNGAIVVDSRVGEGTTFEIYVPLHQAAAEERRRVSAPEVGHGAGRILVVDDEADMLAVMAETLRSAGYEVDSSPDGEHALERIKAGPQSYNLVLTDLTMPRMTGDVLVQEAIKLNPQLPIIMCTGRRDRVEELRKLPLATILTKPVYGENLLQAVALVLRHASQPVSV